MMNNEIRTISIGSFPETFRNMRNPPEELYIRGRLPDSKDQRYLCVVGSRAPSSYGQDVCQKLITGLKGYPISIVSGLAIGIDSYSHKIALEAGLNCIGFPGSRLEWDRLYPSSSVPLAKQIIASGGALLSECGSDFIYAKWAFPSRNRYMAGISHATLVIEARKRSGSLITARYAEDEGRDLMTVPGSIFSDLTYGPHMLLKGCANPVSCSEDILQILGFDVQPRSYLESLAFSELDDTSKKIVRGIAGGEATVDVLSEKLKMSIADLNEKLSMLELEGAIRISGGRLHLAY